MLRRGRGRPRKQGSCSAAALALSRKVRLRRIGKVLRRKQLNLRRQRILELSTANFCSTITGHRSSLRDLKSFARQLGKGAVPPLYSFCQQRAGVLEDSKSSPQCGHDHVDWNSSEAGDIPIFEDVLRSKEDESPFDAHVDQWVGVEVLLFGRKSSIGEVGSTTSNMCDKLRSVIADPERELLCASFAKITEEKEDREWPPASKGDIVPSWLSCRRIITRKRRINVPGAISDCHITALLASLPKTGSHIDGKAMTKNNISSTEDNGPHPLAIEETVIPVDQSSAAVLTVDQGSTAAATPTEQSFASQESIANSGKDSSLDFGKESQANLCVLQQRDAIQVCPTTPEKAQKRRRNYLDTIPNLDVVKDMDACEPSDGEVPDVGNLDAPPAGDNSVQDPGGPLLLMDSLSPYSVDFESSSNSTGIGERGPNNVAAVECARSLVDSIPTPAIVCPFGLISHVASHVVLDPVRESSPLFQTHVPSAPALDMESTKRKGRRPKSSLIKDSSGIAATRKIRKKYKPRVAKVEQTEKYCVSRLQNKTGGNAMDHTLRGGVHRASGTSARDSCISHNNNICGNHEECTGAIGEGQNFLHPEDIIMESSTGELTSKRVPSISPGDLIPSLADNTCLTRSPHSHSPFNLGHDRVWSDSVLCSTCGLKLRTIESDRSEIGRTQENNYLPSPNEYQMMANPLIERQKHFEALSVALSNRVLALLDLPTSIGQPHNSLYSTIAGESERSPSIPSSDVSLFYKEAALQEYPQASDEPGGFSSFSEEWTAYHAGSAEMTALDAFNQEEMRFDTFYKEQQSAVPEDTLFQTLNAEANEYYSAIADTWIGPCIGDYRGLHNLSGSLQCGLDEFGVGGSMQPNSCQGSLMAQMVFPEAVEDRTISSFYASTSAGVNNIMLTRLNQMIEENAQKNALWIYNGEQELDMDVRPDCGQAETPSSCSVDRFSEGFQEVGLLGDYSREEEELMKMRDTVLCEMSSQFQTIDPDSISSTEDEGAVVPAEDTPDQLSFQSQVADPDSNFAGKSAAIVPAEDTHDQLSFQSQDAGPDSNFAGESAAIVPVDGLEDCDRGILSDDNGTPNQICPRNKDTCSVESTPFHLMPFVQLVACIKIILINASEISPLKLLKYVQDHLRDEEKEEFERLWPMILYPINSVQLQKLLALAEIDLPPSMKMIQYPQIEANNVDNHLTDLVPYVGNAAVVAYDGSFFPLRKRKPRPKVNLDPETIRVWKLLMGKTETTENDPDVDNELKWKQEREVMKEQAETFIRRMHLIQGDRSFSRWKGSVVDSVIGVFLTQNVSDVLSSSAFMCLRARFPPGGGSREPLQSKSPEDDIEEEILRNDVQFNPGSQISSSNCASAGLANEGREEILIPQQCCHEESSHTSNLEIRQEGHFPLTLKLQEEEEEDSRTVFYTQPEQPPGNLSEGTSDLDVHGITIVNATASDLESRQEDTLLFAGNEDQGSLSSSIGQAVNNNLGFNAYCTTNAECNLTKAVMLSIESQLDLLLLQQKKTNLEFSLAKELQREQRSISTSIHVPKEVLTGIERARLEAEQVRARKSSKWEMLAEKYNARCQKAAMDAASPRDEMTQDGVDWEAVRCADLEDIADAIKERGMNWKLAGRIKGFLERLQLEQGGIDLEWLRSIPSDDAKEFLSSVHGLGLKSVECIRLLTLHHLAFPVDTNVGRICVRLGWVPLEPLPEKLQLHVLELYPVQASIQKYLWPRLCTLDQQTLYELHYQLITFGKVFCTKSKPNCNACPMRSDCKHFASALSSAKLALPSSDGSSGSETTRALPPGSGFSGEEEEVALQTLSKTHSQPSMCISQYCQPIIEEPMSPESTSSEADMSEFDIEDYPFSVEETITEESMMELLMQEIQGRQKEIDMSNRCCKSNLSTATAEADMDMADLKTLGHVPVQPKAGSSALLMREIQGRQEIDVSNRCCELNLSTTTAETEMDMADLETVALVPAVPPKAAGSALFNSAPSDGGEMGDEFNDAFSREVVVLPPEAASVPAPNLKNIERLRTVHYVYELPDNHPLLEEMDAREADDPCFYLLAIWSPGEVPDSIPNINDENEETGFNFSTDEESIKGTLLVPCRTALQGSFPLNGTYFQVNEVFADHATSLEPVLVPRVLLWNLRRRFVYFGTSITSILRGMTTEEIQACFWRGYVCVRGFDRMTRAPKPLVRRLHFQTTKSVMKSASTKNTKT